MYIILLHRIVENFERYEGVICPSDWEVTTNIVNYYNRNDAVDYLKRLKKEYRGKGKVIDGKITGRKVTRYDGTKTIENIRTELVDVPQGIELEVANEYDVGECPWGE